MTKVPTTQLDRDRTETIKNQNNMIPQTIAPHKESGCESWVYRQFTTVALSLFFSSEYVIDGDWGKSFNIIRILLLS